MVREIWKGLRIKKPLREQTKRVGKIWSISCWKCWCLSWTVKKVVWISIFLAGLSLQSSLANCVIVNFQVALSRSSCSCHSGHRETSCQRDTDRQTDRLRGWETGRHLARQTARWTVLWWTLTASLGALTNHFNATVDSSRRTYKDKKQWDEGGGKVSRWGTCRCSQTSKKYDWQSHTQSLGLPGKLETSKLVMQQRPRLTDNINVSLSLSF